MGTTGVSETFSPEYDRKTELNDFDETKAGVKGLVDAGITKLPRMFHLTPDYSLYEYPLARDAHLSIPVIDLEGFNSDPTKRKEIVDRVRNAAETWGFFQVVNHGIDPSVLEEMKDGVRRFFEQDVEVKKKFYIRDPKSTGFVYNSNFDLYLSKFASWRDTFSCNMLPNPPKPEELPQICSDILLDYSKNVKRLGITLLELLSEALGLSRNHLKEMDCAEGLVYVCHYYPACPEPELTIGTLDHTDKGFITVLLQDQHGGLQVLHESQWLDIPSVPGALVINLGDMLQLISNNKFKSSTHRVVANRRGPRISAASFLSTGLEQSSKLYGPIKEVLSRDEPPIYKETTLQDHLNYVYRNGLVVDGDPLQYLKLQNV